MSSYRLDIRVAGSLVSDVEISDEHLDVLNDILKKLELGEVAVAASRNPEAVRIDFDYSGERFLHMNARNFAFAEKIARLAEIGEEINMGLVGTVVIHELDGDPGNAYMVSVKDGKAVHQAGEVVNNRHFYWDQQRTDVTVGKRTLSLY